MKNPLATTPGIIVVGAVIGLIAVWLQKLGNPANMGICVACFERDVAGGLGLHRAAIVQYLRPEIMGLVLGSLAAALATREFKPRGGSAPLVRFVLGIIAAMGALVFLGCPWRAILRLAGGDGNAILGLAGLGYRHLDRDALLQARLFAGPQQRAKRRLGRALPGAHRRPAPALPRLPADSGRTAERPPLLLREGAGLAARAFHRLAGVWPSSSGSSRSAAASARWGLSAISSFSATPTFSSGSRPCSPPPSSPTP